MKQCFLIISAFFLLPIFTHAQIIYAAPNGNASNSGMVVSLPTTLQQAINTATAGTTIYLRGGRYIFTTKISIPISKSGTATNPIKLFANPGDERPILDYSAMAISSSNRGIELAANYWYLKGFDIYKAGDNGLFLSGSNNTIEFCSFYENGDTGLQMGGGASNNKIINCDSYYNADVLNENADGFAAKLDVGTGNSFFGCRAWQNSDDGWDGYLRPADDVSTTIDSCWAFKNGYLKTGTNASSAGDGNGFKLGGSDNKDLRHNMTVTRCLSFLNRADGFDQNSNIGNITLYNCTGFNNGRNYGLNDRALATGKVMTIKNCISAGTGGQSILTAAIKEADTWLTGFTVSNADFQSVDPTPAYGARNADGSLPNITFMHLTQTSTLRNRGVDVGLPFNGSAPDLGSFETKENVGVKNALKDNEGIVKLYPSVSNGILTVEVDTKGEATLSISDTQSRIIHTQTLIVKGISTKDIDISQLPNGIYFITYTSLNGFMTKRFIKQ